MICTLHVYRIVLVITFFGFAGALFAQAPAPPKPADAPLTAEQDKFINTLDQAELDAVSEVLLRVPPAIPEPRERRLALLLLDGVLHDLHAPDRAPVQDFFKSRMDGALNEIENTRVKEGAIIWKLYNHGFVVRTATVTLGFDLTRGGSAKAKAFPVFDDVLGRIAEKCDALFISHKHGDHADDFVAKAFLNLGKPVVAPPEVWKDQDFYSRLTHLERIAHKEQMLAIQSGKLQLKVIVYPGHQGAAIENNVPLIFTPEGMSFAQTGDQSNNDDFAWIDEVGKKFRVDVLMPNCWSPDIVRVAKGFNPRVIITGHENELGHAIDHREPYALTYKRLQLSPCPFVVMTWGESFRYQPKLK